MVRATVLEALVDYHVMIVAKDKELRATARRNLERALQSMTVNARREYYAIVGKGE